MPSQEGLTPFREAVRRKTVVDALVTGESGAPQLERHLAHALVEAFDLFNNRQRKYGPNNIARFRESGLVVRLHDKLARLAHVYLEGAKGDQTDDTLTDGWFDTAVYALIGLMCHRGQWPAYQGDLFNKEPNAGQSS